MQIINIPSATSPWNIVTIMAQCNSVPEWLNVLVHKSVPEWLNVLVHNNGVPEWLNVLVHNGVPEWLNLLVSLHKSMPE